MQVLVTGGAGFIGSHLCDALLKRAHTVLCVDDLSAGRIDNISHHGTRSSFRLFQMSVNNFLSLPEARMGESIDVVVHCASKKIPRYENAREMLVSNARGAEAAFDLARGHGAKIVFASTSDVYGKGQRLPFKEDGPLTLGTTRSARWGYAASKIFAEHLAFAYAEEFALPVTVLRFFGAYGPRQHLSWWGGPQGVFLRALSSGEPMEIHGDGCQRRCFIFVEDLVQATVRAIESADANGEVINVGGSEEVTILQLAQRMATVAGISKPRFRFIPYSSFPGRYEDVRRRVPDVEKLHRILGGLPTTSLDEGLVRLWRWYETSADVHRARATVRA